MKPDLTATDRWGLRAEWSRFLSEHTARREALVSKPLDEPATSTADHGSRPRAAARRGTSAHGTRAAAPNDAGR